MSKMSKKVDNWFLLLDRMHANAGTRLTKTGLKNAKFEQKKTITGEINYL
jgi:hypothetical protein